MKRESIFTLATAPDFKVTGLSSVTAFGASWSRYEWKKEGVFWATTENVTVGTRSPIEIIVEDDSMLQWKGWIETVLWDGEVVFRHGSYKGPYKRVRTSLNNFETIKKMAAASSKEELLELIEDITREDGDYYYGDPNAPIIAHSLHHDGELDELDE
jgi:hypothetical protein